MAQEIKITQTSNADMNIGIPKNLTAVEWLIDQVKQKDFDLKFIWHKEEVFNEARQRDREERRQLEEQRIKDAIMYALDEDGHTGDWKIKFANDYINNLKQTK